MKKSLQFLIHSHDFESSSPAFQSITESSSGKRKAGFLSLIAGLQIATCLTLGGCSYFSDLANKPVDKGLDELNEAVQKLDNTSLRWEDILRQTQDNLVKQGQSTLANEVSTVLTKATNDASTNVQCTADFFRDRAKDEILKIRSRITGERLSLKPVFCNITTKAIDMNLDPSRRTHIEIAGYNLSADSAKASVEYRDGRTVEVQEALTNPTNYVLSLILDRIADLENAKNIVLNLSDGQTHTIGVIRKYVPPKRQYTKARVHITGSITLNDVETFTSDENKTVSIDNYVEVFPGRSTPYHWEDCVGDEVQGYVDAQLQLDKDTGKVTIQGSSRYFEGTRCGPTDLQGQRLFGMVLGVNQSERFEARMEDSDGGVFPILNFHVESIESVDIPQ